MVDRTLTDSSDIEFTEPAADQVSAEVKAASQTNAKLATMAQATIKGRASGAGTGAPVDLTATQARTILNVQDGATDDQTAAEIRTLGFFDTSNDGTGSGLDADLLDGSHASAFQPVDELLTEIAALATAPGADSGLFLDNSAGAMAYWTPTLGLEFNDANLRMTANQRTAAISFIIDGGGSAITTGVKGYLEIPFACTITAARALADQSGSIVVDIWKDTFANYPPTNADSITASAPVTITTDTDSEDETLTGWTTSVAAGDILGFNVDSITTVERVTISLTVLKA
jgi:hypothetical protein